MKKIVLLLALLLIGSNAYSATRVYRTYKPIPYNRSVNPFAQPCPACEHNYYHGNYNRNYYNPRNNNYYPRYRNSGYNYYPQQNSYSRFRNLNRTMYRNNYYSRPSMINRFRSHAQSSYVPVSYNNDTNVKDPRLSLVEKNIYGKSFEHQEVDLRLNRLEKSMFNKTYPSLSFEERMNNLFVNYNREIQQVSPQELSDLENCVFKKTFEHDSDTDRVSRLEEKVLGAIQPGEINKRVDTLNDAVNGKYLNAASQSPYGACYGGYMPQMYNQTGWRGALNTLGLMFGGGAMTGFTPQISPYDDAHFGLEENGDNQTYVDNFGYGYGNTKRGTGTGVQILD